MLQTSHQVPVHLKRATRDEVIILLDEYDNDNSATIDFREFLHMISPRRQKYYEQNELRKKNRQQTSEIKSMVFSQARYNAAMSRWNKHLDRLWKHGRQMGFNDEEISNLKIEFDKYDEDGSGDIDLKELSAIVRGPAMGRSELSRDELKIMMNEFDYNKSGTITFAGFLEMMSPRRERARNKYMNDLQELKERASITSGLSGGHSIVFKSPRPPTLGSGRRSGGTGGGGGGRRRRSRGGNTPRTPRNGSSGTFGRSGMVGGNPELNDWIDESRGASPKGKPPSKHGNGGSILPGLF